MRGIVRGMDAAPEAHKDVFTAFPRVHPRNPAHDREQQAKQRKRS
jgi:hypothetical protein